MPVTLVSSEKHENHPEMLIGLIHASMILMFVTYSSTSWK